MLRRIHGFSQKRNCEKKSTYDFLSIQDGYLLKIVVLLFFPSARRIGSISFLHFFQIWCTSEKKHAIIVIGNEVLP